MDAALRARRRFRELFLAQPRQDQATQQEPLPGPWPILRTPHFLEARHQRLFAEVTRTIMSAIECLGRAFFTDERLARYLRIPPRVDHFVRLDPGYSGMQVVTRLDALFSRTSGELKFVEFNCDNPSGMGIYQQLVREVESLEVYRQLAGELPLEVNDLVRPFAELLRRKTAEFLRSRGKPAHTDLRFAMVGPRSTIIHLDLVALAAALNELGLTATYADVQELTSGAETLRGPDGQTIDVLFRDDILEYLHTQIPVERMARLKERALLGLVQASDLSRSLDGLLARHLFGRRHHAVLRGYRKGFLCVLNPFRAHVVDLKSVMAVMQHESFQHLFSEEQRACIARHVPWTRLLQDEMTTFRGQREPLLQLVRHNRELFVLKPDSGCGGAGVVIGRDTDDGAWQEAVQLAIQPGAPHVVQEHIELPVDEFPAPAEGGGIAFREEKVNVNFWAFDGEYGGTYARVAPASVINVKMGARLAPVVFVDTR